MECCCCCSVARSWQLFVTPWTAARQASLSFTISQTLLTLMSIESVMPSNHLILCYHFLLLPSVFPSVRFFSMSQLFTSGGQSIGASASASALSMNTQDWSPLGWTGLTSLQSKWLSGVLFSTTFPKHEFFGAQPTLWSNSHMYITTGKTIAWTRLTFVSKVISLLFNMLSRFVIVFIRFLDFKITLFPILSILFSLAWSHSV